MAYFTFLSAMSANVNENSCAKIILINQCLWRLALQQVPNDVLVNLWSQISILYVSLTLGTAAFQVEGDTLHRLLNIPINVTHNNPIPELRGDALRSLQQRLEGCKLLVIDEMSMISKLFLYQISERLKQAFPHNADKPFGGISIGGGTSSNFDIFLDRRRIIFSLSMYLGKGFSTVVYSY